MLSFNLRLTYNKGQIVDSLCNLAFFYAYYLVFNLIKLIMYKDKITLSKDYAGLMAGTVLTYNGETSTYEYISRDENITDEGTHIEDKHMVFSLDHIKRNTTVFESPIKEKTEVEKLKEEIVSLKNKIQYLSDRLYYRSYWF